MNANTETTWGMQPNIKMAKQLATRDVPSLVYDAINLEGVAMTLPEVQTILDGITVGGHKISDQNMAINQANTWHLLFDFIDKHQFGFLKSTALTLHNTAGKEEAFEWGKFRSGNVTISGSEYEPPSFKDLNSEWTRIEKEINAIPDIYDRAIAAFLKMARVQFFWVVNKRMGRFMMNGILLSEGYPIINVPAKRQQEFNQLMLDFYHSDNMQYMNSFLRTCLNPKIIENFQAE